jgi:hypothetical protein
LIDTEADSVLEDSHVANIEETETLSRSSSVTGIASPAPNGPAVKGHRSQTSRCFYSIFGRGSSHPDSPAPGEGRPESPSASGKERVREKNGKKRHCFFSLRKGEALALEEEHKEFGDGWQEFRKGQLFPLNSSRLSLLLTSKDRDIYISDFVRDPVILAAVTKV